MHQCGGKGHLPPEWSWRWPRPCGADAAADAVLEFFFFLGTGVTGGGLDWEVASVAGGGGVLIAAGSRAFRYSAYFEPSRALIWSLFNLRVAFLTTTSVTSLSCPCMVMVVRVEVAERQTCGSVPRGWQWHRGRGVLRSLSTSTTPFSTHRALLLH